MTPVIHISKIKKILMLSLPINRVVSVGMLGSHRCDVMNVILRKAQDVAKE